jgi:hypothetical protein
MYYGDMQSLTWYTIAVILRTWTQICSFIWVRASAIPRCTHRVGNCIVSSSRVVVLVAAIQVQVLVQIWRPERSDNSLSFRVKPVIRLVIL